MIHIRASRLRILRAVLALGLYCGLAGAAHPNSESRGPHRGGHRPHYLTPPSALPALEIGKRYLREHAPAMGLADEDFDELHVTHRHVDARSGTEHLYLRQRLDGIEVEGGDLSVAVDAGGRLLVMQDRLVRGLRTRPGARRASLSAVDAILAAAAHLGITPEGTPVRRSATPSPARGAVHAPAGISRDEIPVKLVYVVDSTGAVRLGWNIVIRTPDGRHWWDLYLDAARGEVLQQSDWIVRDVHRVYPLPLASPDEGPRELLAHPADNVASPYGWYDTNGSAGAEFTDTRGNNVFAQDDIDADDSGGTRPDGGAGLDFDFPLDLDTMPGNYLEASVAQLFYVCNVVHDVMYQYGFDESAGNFQENNYGNGGSPGDPVQADSQDGLDVDNAQFGTPPDGLDPRMETFRWIQTPSPRLTVSTPAAIAGLYPATAALFGGATTGLPGTLVRALDPADVEGPSTTDACTPLTNAGAVSGNIALIDRGICTFVTKVANAQAAGASGVVIANNAGDMLVNMSGVDPSLTIPVIFIGQTDGATIAAQLGAGVNGTLTSVAARDASLDTGLVVHEYAHGITNRLTGGASNVNCLDAPESAGMGEGFSDWFALLMTAMPNDLSTDRRGISPYLVNQPSTGAGIRNAPYSTDLAVSPFTYGDIDSLNQPHGVGEVWASALWEMYWNFVDFYGFDADLYAGTGGNNRALQLVTDALKLQPCDPTMVEGRDALLTADLAASGGVNECLLWNAFAKRGLGVGAADAGGPDSLSVTEDFEVPVVCLPEPGSAAMLVSVVFLLSALRRQRQRSGR